MKRIKQWWLVSMVLLVAGCATYNPMQTAKSVDLQKYMGKWYEIARLPNSFQKGCHCSTAEYKVLDKDTISVTNTCYKDGKLKEATATAWRSNADDNSKLKVRFFWPFTGKYWILYVSDDYQYAVIGEPSREYLWFLSRTKNISQQQLDLMKKIAIQQGYNLDQLIVANNFNC
ncbi:lipocalin family protein [Cysteiniphilum litorale]|uniref:lipocalin family protein n=1 Tax=Cysteiniphilum litorale TaxID=2056700 RepID=UPI003F885019